MKTKKKIDPSALPVLTEKLDEPARRKKPIPILTDILSESDASSSATQHEEESFSQEPHPFKAPFRPRTPHHAKQPVSKVEEALPKNKSNSKAILKQSLKEAEPKKVQVQVTKQVASPKTDIKNSILQKMTISPKVSIAKKQPVKKELPLEKRVVRASFSETPTEVAKVPKRSGVLMDQSSFQELEERLSERVQKEIIERLTSTLDHHLLQQVSSILEKTLNLLSDEIKNEMQKSLESIVSQAISDELKLLKQRIDKVNKL